MQQHQSPTRKGVDGGRPAPYRTTEPERGAVLKTNSGTTEETGVVDSATGGRSGPAGGASNASVERSASAGGAFDGFNALQDALPVPHGPLGPPRDDLLSEDQARALHAELLAGHKQPKGVPQWALDKIDIADSGCGTSFGNRRELFRDMYLSPSRVNGAAGAFMTKEKGTMFNPLMDDAGRLGAYREEHAILHEACAYTLIAVGRASREQGVSMYMPGYGQPGYFMFPSGVRVTLLNRHVLVMRPIGYKVSPESHISCLASSVVAAMDVPKHGPYIVYLGANLPRPGDLRDAARAVLGCGTVAIDLTIDQDAHDLRREAVTAALCVLVAEPRCAGVFGSPPCTTWSVSHNMPDRDGNPGRPLRSIDHPLGYLDAEGQLPLAVADANLVADNVARIMSAAHKAGKTVHGRDAGLPASVLARAHEGMRRSHVHVRHAELGPPAPREPRRDHHQRPMHERRPRGRRVRDAAQGNGVAGVGPHRPRRAARVRAARVQPWGGRPPTTQGHHGRWRQVQDPGGRAVLCPDGHADRRVLCLNDANGGGRGRAGGVRGRRDHGPPSAQAARALSVPAQRVWPSRCALLVQSREGAVRRAGLDRV